MSTRRVKPRGRYDGPMRSVPTNRQPKPQSGFWGDVMRGVNGASNAAQIAAAQRMALLKAAAEASGGSGDTLGGGSYGYGGGGGGSAAAYTNQVNNDYNARVGEVKQIDAETAARLKAIQDQYSQAVNGLQAGIRSDMGGAMQAQSQQAAVANKDLAAQGFSQAPVQQMNNTETAALRDAAARQNAYLGQVAQGQMGNFADRQMGQAQLLQGYLSDLAAQKTAALSAASGGGGGGGGGGRGGGGGGGGGSGSSSDYKARINAQGDLNYAQDLANGENYGTYRNQYGNEYLGNVNPFSHKNESMRYNVWNQLHSGANANALLSRYAKKGTSRTAGYIKGYIKARQAGQRRTRKPTNRDIQKYYQAY